MALTIKCVHCGRKVKRNPRIKEGQHYCGLAGCQQARKNTWEREKNKKDGCYRTGRMASKKRWLKEHPGSLYQENYRSTHPDYVQFNRSYDTSKSIGSFAVVVDPLDEQAQSLYSKYDFISLSDSGMMLLSMKKIELLFF